MLHLSAYYEATSLRVSRDHSIPLTPFHHSSLTLCFLHKFNSTLEFCPKDTKHALRLEKRRMYNYCAYDLLFLHFGTSNEVLDYLSEVGSKLVDQRHLCSVLAIIIPNIFTMWVVIYLICISVHGARLIALKELMEMEEKLVRKNRVLFKSKLAVGSWWQSSCNENKVATCLHVLAENSSQCPQAMTFRRINSVANRHLSLAHWNCIAKFSSTEKFIIGKLQFGWSSARTYGCDSYGEVAVPNKLNLVILMIIEDHGSSYEETQWLRCERWTDSGYSSPGVGKCSIKRHFPALVRRAFCISSITILTTQSILPLFCFVAKILSLEDELSSDSEMGTERTFFSKFLNKSQSLVVFMYKGPKYLSPNSSDSREHQLKEANHPRRFWWEPEVFIAKWWRRNYYLELQMLMVRKEMEHMGMPKSPRMENVTNFVEVDPTVASLCEMDLGKREGKISSHLLCWWTR